MRPRIDIDADDARWWGDWVRPPEHAALFHAGAGRLFQVSLERCTTPARASDLLRIVADKPWATQRDLDDLRGALAHLTGFSIDAVPAVWPATALYIEIVAGGRQG
ncbi:MAG TPA: hypothetical protein VMZ28_25705 [Kofleriaceae bacterium]|nr:hypothetical protein [Kofleriaceae bacterium]